MRQFKKVGSGESVAVNGGWGPWNDLVAIGLIALFAFGIAPAFIRRMFGR